MERRFSSNAMEIAAESAEDAPKATPSERTINDATKRRQAGVSVVGADFVRGRDNSFEDGRWGHVKSKARSLENRLGKRCFKRF